MTTTRRYTAGIALQNTCSMYAQSAFVYRTCAHVRANINLSSIKSLYTGKSIAHMFTQFFFDVRKATIILIVTFAIVGFFIFGA